MQPAIGSESGVHLGRIESSVLQCPARIQVLQALFVRCGGVAEWTMAPVLKTGIPSRDRGFESHPLRHIFLLLDIYTLISDE